MIAAISSWRPLTHLPRNQIRVDSSFDQRLRDAAVKIVHAFDLSRLNRPLPNETLPEYFQRARLIEIATLIVPELQQRTKFAVRQTAPVSRQILESWWPAKIKFDTLTRLRSRMTGICDLW